MADFPRRMRDWLFNIMRDLADRSELTPHYLKMEREAESNMTRRWTNAAVWKFCDLDGYPPDRFKNPLFRYLPYYFHFLDQFPVTNFSQFGHL